MNPEDTLEQLSQELARLRAERPRIQREGEAALRRLYSVAHGHSGQCRLIAMFLLGCYNGERFPFDLTEFRGLDSDLFDDCLAVLRMDWSPELEVHRYFPDGGAAFEGLARTWTIPDRSACAG
jgi:hypothetical protein